MKCHINNYYKTIVEDMIGQILNSVPGKRIWLTDPITGYNDYSLSIKSTYPTWCRFFHNHTPKNYPERYDLDFVAYEHGFYNGNTREILILLNKLLLGEIYTSERRYSAIDLMFKGIAEYIEEYEYQNQCSYFW